MIKLENVSVSYGSNKVLDNVNLKLEEGKLNVIIGKNGCGKSTLLKAITNQLKFEGIISINDVSLKLLFNKKRAQIISYLPQITSSANISVERLVQHGRYPYTTYNRKLNEKDFEIINKSLVYTDVLHLRNKYLSHLSGGERQRAFLAMILAQDTDIIVLDEPCNFLDIDHQISILNIIKELKGLGKTIVLVLHDLQQAFTIADEIIVIDQGKVLIKDSPDIVAKSDILESIFNLKVRKQSIGIYKYYLEER